LNIPLNIELNIELKAKLLINELEKPNGNPPNPNPNGDPNPPNPNPNGDPNPPNPNPNPLPNHALADSEVIANAAPAEHIARIFLNIPVLYLLYLDEGISSCLILLMYLVEIQPVQSYYY